MRTRPRFNNWHVIVNVVFVPSLLNRSEVLEFFEIAGFREGLGDWRPKFGKFSVKEIELAAEWRGGAWPGEAWHGPVWQGESPLRGASPL